MSKFDSGGHFAGTHYSGKQKNSVLVFHPPEKKIISDHACMNTNPLINGAFSPLKTESALERDLQPGKRLVPPELEVSAWQ